MPAPPWTRSSTRSSSSLAGSRPRPLRARAGVCSARSCLASGHAPYPAMPQSNEPFDLDSYAAEAERFVSALDREYYHALRGSQGGVSRSSRSTSAHAGLFERDGGGAAAGARSGRQRPGTTAPALPLPAPARGRGLHRRADQGAGDRARRAREHARDRVERHGEESYRQAAIVQANEPDPERRAEIEQARNEVLESELNPLHARSSSGRTSSPTELGWPSYRAMFEELKGVDLERLGAPDAERSRRPPTRPTATSSSRSSCRRPASASTSWSGARTSPTSSGRRRYDDTVPAGAAGRGLRAHARRARHRPAQPVRTCTLDLEQRPQQERARLLRAGARAGRGLPRHSAHGWPRRLRGALPRGRAHRALRERRRRPAVRVPLSRRQLGHGGVRVPVRAPDRGPDLARRRAGHPDGRSAISTTSRANKLVFLRRYAAKLAYELELHAAAAARRDAGAVLPACWATPSGSSGRGHVPRRRRRGLLRAPTTCARGRSRRTLRRILRERFGAGMVPAPRRRASFCARSGARASG